MTGERKCNVSAPLDVVLFKVTKGNILEIKIIVIIAI